MNNEPQAPFGTEHIEVNAHEDPTVMPDSAEGAIQSVVTKEVTEAVEEGLPVASAEIPEAGGNGVEDLVKSHTEATGEDSGASPDITVAAASAALKFAQKEKAAADEAAASTAPVAPAAVEPRHQLSTHEDDLMSRAINNGREFFQVMGAMWRGRHH